MLFLKDFNRNIKKLFPLICKLNFKYLTHILTWYDFSFQLNRMQSSLVHIFFRRSLSTFYSPLCFQFTDVLWYAQQTLEFFFKCIARGINCLLCSTFFKWLLCFQCRAFKEEKEIRSSDNQTERGTKKKKIGKADKAPWKKCSATKTNQWMWDTFGNNQ